MLQTASSSESQAGRKLSVGLASSAGQCARRSACVTACLSRKWARG